MNAKFITTPKGERLAILPADEYEDMRDALIHAQASAEYRAGADQGVTFEEMESLLAAPTPLAFWRAKRAATLESLAEAAGATVADILSYERGTHRGAREQMAKIAAALNVSVDELMA